MVTALLVASTKVSIALGSAFRRGFSITSNGITKPILLLEGFFNEQDFAHLNGQ